MDLSSVSFDAFDGPCTSSVDGFWIEKNTGEVVDLVTDDVDWCRWCIDFVDVVFVVIVLLISWWYLASGLFLQKWMAENIVILEFQCSGIKKTAVYIPLY